MTNKISLHPARCCSLLLTVVLALLSACENKWPRNGYLDGQWQLLSIEHDGIVTDVKDKQLYLSFQLELFQLNPVGNQNRYYGYFDRTGDQIVFRQFSHIAERDIKTDDNLPIPPEEQYLLRQWGYYSPYETFHIESLDAGNMVLRSDSARIVYRKF